MIKGYAKKKAGGRVKPLARDGAGNVAITVAVYDEDGTMTDREYGTFNGPQLRALLEDRKTQLDRIKTAQKAALDGINAEIADLTALEKDVAAFEAAEDKTSGAPDKKVRK